MSALRVAAIDAGSNAIRFVAADFPPPWTPAGLSALGGPSSAPGGPSPALDGPPKRAGGPVPLDYSIVARLRVPVRLGHGVFTEGSLDQRTMDEAVAAFRRFRAEMDRLGVDAHRAVATSATREADNRDRFLDRICRESDIVLEPISGREEARLVHLAASRRVDFSTGRWTLVDLGGGSVEVSLVDRAGIMRSESHRLGTVRLLETMKAADGCAKTVREWVSREVRDIALPSAPPAPSARSKSDETGDNRPAGLVATGGNAEAIAKLVFRHVNPLRTAVVSKRRLDAVVHLLAGMTVRERIKQLGLRPNRADVILPAALVYQHFAQLVGVDRIFVPNAGVKDGVLLDLAADGTQERRPLAGIGAESLLAPTGSS